MADGCHIGYICAIYCPINAKFCVKKQNHVQTQATWPKYQIWKVKMADGCHFENGFIAISAGNHPISMTFGVQTQILVSRTVTCWIIRKYEIRNRGKSRYSPRVIVRLTRYLVEPCSDTRHVTKIAIFENSRWRKAAILKMVPSLYLSRGSSDFNEIWCATADFGSNDGRVT